MEDGFTCMQTLHTDTHSPIYKYVCVLTHTDTGDVLRPNRYASLLQRLKEPLRSFMARGHKLFYPSKCVCVWPSSIDVLVCAMSVFYRVCVLCVVNVVCVSMTL